MTEQQGLLEIAQRAISDQDFRELLMTAPRETLTTELGISRENYDALLALVPALLIGGLFVLGNGITPDGEGWGRWGTA